MNDRELFEKWYEGTYKVDEDARFEYRTSSVEEIAFEAWQQAEITRLTALIESYKLDAERYRWLRNSTSKLHLVCPESNDCARLMKEEFLSNSELDKAIDQAMKGKG